MSLGGGGKGGGGGSARNASWRNLDSTLQELSNAPIQEAAQSMSVGNWASALLTGGDVTSVASGAGKDAWSGYSWEDPVQAFNLPTGSMSYGPYDNQSFYTTSEGGSPGTGGEGKNILQFNPSGTWTMQAGPVLGAAYNQDIYNINQANELEATAFGRAGQDYAQVEQDRQMTMALQNLLTGDVGLMDQQMGNIDQARAATYGLETGTGLFGTQQAYVDQAVASGKAAVQQRLASMGLGESTQNAMLQNQVEQAGAATAGQLIQGNISLSEAQQNLEQQLYGTDVSRYGADIQRQQADITQQQTDAGIYQLDSNLGLSEQQISQQAVTGLLGIQTSLQQTLQEQQQASSQFFNNALAPYGYILSDLATRSGVNVSNAQIAEQAQASQNQGMGSLMSGLGSLFGGSGGLGGLLGGAAGGGSLLGAAAGGSAVAGGAVGGGGALAGAALGAAALV